MLVWFSEDSSRFRVELRQNQPWRPVGRAKALRRRALNQAVAARTTRPLDRSGKPDPRCLEAESAKSRVDPQESRETVPTSCGTTHDPHQVEFDVEAGVGGPSGVLHPGSLRVVIA